MRGTLEGGLRAVAEAESTDEELENENEEEEIEARNRDLEEILEFYDAYDLLPVAQHVMWLSSVKEALGYIPFQLDYFTIRCLVIFKEEVNKKSVADSQRMQADARSASSHSSSGATPSGLGTRTPVGLDKALMQS